MSNQTEMFCPSCDSTRIHSKEALDEFPHGGPGTGLPRVMLTATVLVWDCVDCGERWTGADAENARALAVEEHLRKTHV